MSAPIPPIPPELLEELAMARLERAVRIYEEARRAEAEAGQKIREAREAVGRARALAAGITEGDIVDQGDGRWEVVGFSSSPIANERTVAYVTLHPLRKDGQRRKEGPSAIRRTLSLDTLINDQGDTP